MTQRINLVCNTCEHGITLRSGLGAQERQIIAVQCPNCKEKVGVIFTLKESEEKLGFPTISLEKCINSELRDKEDDNFTAINVHPELIYPKGMIYEKLLLSEGMASRALSEHAIENGFFDEKKARGAMNDLFPGLNMISIFQGLGGDANLLKDWDIIQRCWRLKNNDKEDIYNKEVIKYTNYKALHKNSRTFNDILFNFFYRFINPNIKLYNKLEDEFEKARKFNTQEFLKVQKCYLEDLHTINWKNYLKIFNEYFKNFDEYNRLLLNTKIELHPADGVESVFCPINFDNVDMFYGNAYENITSHIELLVLINNVIEGRDYDKFLDSSVTINKYRKKFTKESKKGPLKSNNTFDNFTLHFDSKIRNASHHRWFYVDDSNPERLMYKSGGTGALNYISYIDYIYKCNQMALSLASLIMIEIYLMEQ